MKQNTYTAEISSLIYIYSFNSMALENYIVVVKEQKKDLAFSVCKGSIGGFVVQQWCFLNLSDQTKATHMPHVGIHLHVFGRVVSKAVLLEKSYGTHHSLNP